MNGLKTLPAIAICLLVLFLILLGPAAAVQTITPAHTPTATTQITDRYAQVLTDEINAEREHAGRELLIPDENLQYAAEQQAAYLLSIGNLTERGPKQTSIQSMASDFGYGGGAPFTLHQTIAMSSIRTLPKTILSSVWLATPKDKATLLNEKMVHIGVGMAEDARRRFIVVFLAALEDQSVVYTPLPTYDIRTPRPDKSPTPTLKPLQASTALPDGSVIHLVEKGQTLSEIAMAYEVNWDSLALQNRMDLKNPIILEGQELVIRPKFTATVTPTITNTPRPPTRTPRPTFTKSETELTPLPVSVTATPTAEPLTKVSFRPPLIFEEGNRKVFAWILMGASGLGLILALGIRHRKK